jgi:hypothetical protein
MKCWSDWTIGSSWIKGEARTRRGIPQIMLPGEVEYFTLSLNLFLEFLKLLVFQIAYDLHNVNLTVIFANFRFFLLTIHDICSSKSIRVVCFKVSEGCQQQLNRWK